MMTDYKDKKDLVRILVEGTPQERALIGVGLAYGEKKADELRKELEKQGNGNFRGASKYEELPEIVEKVISGKTVSIDDVVESSRLERTVNLVKKISYYPLVGMLPAKYQEEIAKKYGDDPRHYTMASVVLDGILGVGFAIMVHKMTGIEYSGNIIGSLLGYTIGRRFVIAKADHEPVGSALAFLPTYLTLYAITKIRKAKEERELVKRVAKVCSEKALKQFNEENKPETQQPLRVETEKPDVIEAEFEADGVEERRTRR